jgi:hypothetical protein
MLIMGGSYGVLIIRVIFDITKAGNISLSVFDVNGSLIAGLAQGYFAPGYCNVKLNGSKLASGVNFINLQSGGNISTQKILLLK